jgi:hypothetical protein
LTDAYGAKHVSRLVKPGNAHWRFSVNPEAFPATSAFSDTNPRMGINLSAEAGFATRRAAIHRLAVFRQERVPGPI